MNKTYLVAGAAVAMLTLGGGGWWISHRADADAVQYRTSKIERGPLQATVSASGAVNPVTQVSVGTQVSGQIRDLYVDFNSEVKAGQLIAQIDPETFEYRVRSAQADVDAARAATMTQQAALAKARVDADELQRDFERKTQLVAKQFIAESEAQKAQAMARSGAENVKLVAAQLQSAQANVAQRQAALAQAGIDLARTRITSPVSGIVIKRAIEKGQTVAASLQSPELFVIAQNLQDMQVDASIDESDVGRIRSGQKATFTVDAFPGQTFEGEVRQVRKAAQNVANVVTYVAVVGFSNTGGRLLPGMTANVRVVTDLRESVLKVPNAALRVRIAGVEAASASAASAATSAPTPAPVQPTPDPGAVPPGPPGTSAGAPGGGGALTDFRNRLVAELALSASQTEKVDAIYADARPRFGQLRDVSAEERPKARERLMADVRARIGDVLTPAQKQKYAGLVAQAAASTSTRGRIYLLAADGKPRAYNVRLGITDGTSTELLVSPNDMQAQEIRESASVIIGTQGGAASAARAPTGGPRMPF